MSKKSHFCKICSDDNAANFYKFRKNICKKCLSNQESERYKTNYKNKRDNSITYRLCDFLKKRVQSAKLRAKYANREFNLDVEFIEELIKLQQYKCKYSGITFKNTSPLYSVSIDRINSSKGYTKDNIQLVCSVINRMKSNLEEREFLHIIKEIRLNNLRQKRKSSPEGS